MITKAEASVTELAKFFWKSGYLACQRKYAKFLPEPEKIGKYSVDIVAKKKDRFAIGIILTPNDFKNPQILIDKLVYLSSLNNSYENDPILLFIGVEPEYFNQLKELVSSIPEKYRRKIKIFSVNLKFS